jgi:uncharacterized protein involved in exopolysaccharide biosynthesis
MLTTLPSTQPVTAKPYLNSIVLWQLLLRKRSILTKITVLGFVGSLILAFFIPARYSASAVILAPDPQNQLNAALSTLLAGSGASLLSGSSASSLLNVKSPNATYIAVLTSRAVEDRIIDQFDLRKVYWRAKYADTRNKLESRTTIEEDRKTGALVITFADHDPRRASDVVNAYLEYMNSDLARINSEAARREREFAEGQMLAVHRKLDDSLQALAKFSSENATPDMQSQGRVLMESAVAIKSQLISAEAELRALEGVYGDDNARVRALRGKVGTLQHEFNKIAGSSTNRSDDDPYPSLRDLPLLGTTYAELNGRVKINQALYEALVRQYELSQLQESREFSPVRILDRPEIPEKRSFPPRIAIVLITTAGMFLLAFAWQAYRYLESQEYLRVQES